MSSPGTTDFRTIGRRLDRGIRLGVARALAEHKRAGRSIYVLRNGRIVRIKAEDIHVEEEKKR